MTQMLLIVAAVLVGVLGVIPLIVSSFLRNVEAGEANRAGYSASRRAGGNPDRTGARGCGARSYRGGGSRQGGSNSHHHCRAGKRRKHP